MRVRTTYRIAYDIDALNPVADLKAFQRSSKDSIHDIEDYLRELARGINVNDPERIQNYTRRITGATSYAIQPKDHWLLCDDGPGNVAVQLPAPAEALTHVYGIKKIGAGGGPTTTITVVGGANMDGVATVVLTVQYSRIVFVSDGVQYWRTD